MTNTRKLMEEAVDAQNIKEVRQLILDTLRRDAGHASALNVITMAMSRTKNLFVDDNGLFPLFKKDCWTDDYADKLESALSENFSREKLLAFVDVMSDLKRHHSDHRNRAEEASRNDHAAALFAVADTFIEG